MNLNPDDYTTIDIKKFFTKNTSINFLNDYTLQDIEDAKKKIYFKVMNEVKSQEELKFFLDRIADKLFEEKFTAGLSNNQGVVVKNTVRDTLNPNYKNTTNRVVLVDSQYRPQLTNTETNFIMQLNERLTNVVSMEITNIQIPYTFYNIETRQYNNIFTLSDGTTTWTIKIPDGHYTLSTIITTINSLIHTNTNRNDFTFGSPSDTTGLITITNSSNDKIYTINFMPSGTRLNGCLGWYLGFRNYTGENVVNANSNTTLQYTIQHNTSVTGTAIANIPITKYIIVVVEDFNNNQVSDSLIQTKLDQDIIKPTSYFTQNPYLDILNTANLSSYISELGDERTLTKKQLYTRSQQNQTKINLMFQNLRLEVFSPNQVLGIYPFDSMQTWNTPYFTDKCDYKRQYFGPADIDRLQIKLYDDKGNLLELNGNNWHMTILTEHLYKY
jgi:hypothetical protein